MGRDGRGAGAGASSVFVLFLLNLVKCTHSPVSSPPLPITIGSMTMCRTHPPVHLRRWHFINQWSPQGVQGKLNSSFNWNHRPPGGRGAFLPDRPLCYKCLLIWRRVKLSAKKRKENCKLHCTAFNKESKGARGVTTCLGRRRRWFFFFFFFFW